jgi:hypothetical protein
MEDPRVSTKPFDATVKELIECDAAAWSALAGMTGVRRVSVIDADVSTVTAAADKVILVEGANGNSILDVEPTTGFGADLPGRLHLYSAILYHRHHLPVRCVALLLRREANAANLTGVLELRHPDEADPYDVFRYQVVRLWQEPLAPLLAGGLGTLPLAALTDEAEANMPDVLQRIEQRLRAEAPGEKGSKLRVATFLLMGLRYQTDLIRTCFKEPD